MGEVEDGEGCGSCTVHYPARSVAPSRTVLGPRGASGYRPRRGAHAPSPHLSRARSLTYRRVGLRGPGGASRHAGGDRADLHYPRPRVRGLVGTRGRGLHAGTP